MLRTISQWMEGALWIELKNRVWRQLKVHLNSLGYSPILPGLGLVNPSSKIHKLSSFLSKCPSSTGAALTLGRSWHLVPIKLHRSLQLLHFRIATWNKYLQSFPTNNSLVQADSLETFDNLSNFILSKFYNYGTRYCFPNTN